MPIEKLSSKCNGYPLQRELQSILDAKGLAFETMVTTYTKISKYQLNIFVKRIEKILEAMLYPTM